mmetsp:Transcript_29901/g.68938  ORF Transcript_29901/g.68938 Transcript_29901/m.68938 type:complete len:432 (+) Transcript_29901:964-2259(+)
MFSKVAHDAQEPCKIQELVLADDAITVDVEDFTKPFAMFVVHSIDVCQTQLDDDWEELCGLQIATAVLVEFDELLATSQYEFLAVEVLEHLFWHEGNHLVHNGTVVVELLEHIFNPPLTICQLCCLLSPLTFLRLHVSHDEDEACKVDELRLCENPIAFNVKHLDKVLAMFIRERKMLCPAQLHQHRYRFTGLQDSALVLVQLMEVFQAHLRELRAHYLRLKIEGQERNDVINFARTILQVFEELTNLLCAEQEFRGHELSMGARELQVRHDNNILCKRHTICRGNDARPLLVKESSHVRKVLHCDHILEWVYLAQLADEGEELGGRNDSSSGLIQRCESTNAHLLEPGASDFVHKYPRQVLHHLRQELLILLKQVQPIRHLALHLDMLRSLLNLLALGCEVQEVHHREELNEVHELVSHDHTVLVHVKDV